MDSQRRSQSPMGTSQRMGTARAIFDMPPELETNRRLTRSIRNTSNDPVLTETWKQQYPVSPQYDLKKPETDQFVFRNVQTYTPPEVQQSFQYKKPDYAESRSSRAQYQSYTPQQPSIVTPQYDQPKPISYEVQQTTFKSSEFRPTDSYRPADFKQFDYKKPSEVNYDFQQPITSSQRPDLYKTEITTLKPSTLGTDIYKTQQLTRQSDIQPVKYTPPQITNDEYKPEFYRPGSTLPQQSQNQTNSYKPDTFKIEQTRAATYKPTETFKSQTDNFQPSTSYKPSYRPETYKATDSYIATDAYKPKDEIMLVQEKSKIAQENYKPESSYKPAQSYKPEGSAKQYDPQLSYLQKPVDEFIIVESPNSEHEFQAQCNIF